MSPFLATHEADLLRLPATPDGSDVLVYEADFTSMHANPLANAMLMREDTSWNTSKGGLPDRTATIFDVRRKKAVADGPQAPVASKHKGR